VPNFAAGSEDDDRTKRIEHRKQQAKDLAGGEMTTGGAEDCPPGITQKLLEYLVAFEKAPSVTDFKKLEDAGVRLPAPDPLEDAAPGCRDLLRHT